MRHSLLFAFIAFAVSAARSNTIPDGGRDVLPAEVLTTAKTLGSKDLVKFSQDTFPAGKGWRLEVLNDQAGPFKLQLISTVTGEVNRN